MGCMPRIRARRKRDTDDHELVVDPELLTGLRAALGHRPVVLAMAKGEGALCVATPQTFCVHSADAWQVIGWENIQNGDWDNDSQTLSWMLLDGTVGRASVTDTDRLPGVFRERVRASILVEDTTEVSEGKGSVLIAGRKNPGGDGVITWTAQALRRTDLADPEVAEHIVRRTAELRAEFTV
jgi:hypothetical protein